MQLLEVILGIFLGALGMAAWLLVRAYGRERAKAAERTVELERAQIDREKEERKSALDAEPLPADPDDFWVIDEPD